MSMSNFEILFLVCLSLYIIVVLFMKNAGRLAETFARTTQQHMEDWDRLFLEKLKREQEHSQ